MNNSRLEKLLEFIQQEPNDPFLKYALATEYLSMGDKKTALAYFEELLKKHPGYVGTYYHLGRLYETLNRPEDAANTYREGMKVAKEAGDNHAFSELQSVYIMLTDFDFDDE